MEASLHRNYELATKLSRNEVSLMTDSCRHRKSRNILIWNDCLVLYLICKLAKSAAKNDSGKRLAAFQPCCNIFSCSHYLLYSWIHGYKIFSNKILR